MNCVLCGGETKNIYKHCLFKTNIDVCKICGYTFESEHVTLNKNVIYNNQSNNSGTFGLNKQRNLYYVNILQNIKNKTNIKKLLEIGTPSNYDFLKRTNEKFKDIKIYSHDIIENTYPDYISFYKEKDSLLKENIDILFCIHTLEHIPVYEILDFVKFCESVCKYYVFEIPCCETKERILKSSTNPHYSFFSENIIRSIFKDKIEVSKNKTILKFNNLPFKLY